MAFSIFRFGQEDVLEPYLEKFLTAAETMIDMLGFHKASTVLEYGFPQAARLARDVARLDEWLADNDAPKGASATSVRPAPTSPAPSPPRSATPADRMTPTA